MAQDAYDPRLVNGGATHVPVPFQPGTKIIPPAPSAPHGADAISTRQEFSLAGGWGIEGGIPYGSQLHAERDSLRQRWYYAPAVASALAAATKRALGR